jgi:hypothetical protein
MRAHRAAAGDGPGTPAVNYIQSANQFAKERNQWYFPVPPERTAFATGHFSFFEQSCGSPSLLTLRPQKKYHVIKNIDVLTRS